MSDDCLFCAIASGAIPSEKVLENDHLVAFRDIAPKAPTHVLVVPRLHVENVAELAATDASLLAEMAAAAQEIADRECGGEFRWIFNTGAAAGQTVFHVHGHVLGGGELGWEPA
ncbi:MULTISPECIES: histidine triad nucleotide-binding protein [Demequina]|nr:histidine triad nucleotide-binding protein [Demequina litorisediminis]